MISWFPGTLALFEGSGFWGCFLSTFRSLWPLAALPSRVWYWGTIFMYQVCYFSLVSFELIEWIEDPSGGQSKKQARVDMPKVKTMNEKKKSKLGYVESPNWVFVLSWCSDFRTWVTCLLGFLKAVSQMKSSFTLWKIATWLKFSQN